MYYSDSVFVANETMKYTFRFDLNEENSLILSPQPRGRPSNV